MKTHEILMRYFQRKKTKYGFSMRALAQQLDVSAPFLSQVLSGKKAVPYALLLRLQPLLEIEPEVFETIRLAHVSHIDGEASAPLRGRREVKTHMTEWQLSDAATNTILRQWFYLAILEFTTLKKFDGTAECIARNLKLAPETVAVALRELAHLELIHEENGKWIKAKKKLRWGSAKTLPEIRGFHHLMMVKAQENLKLTSPRDFERRLISGVTLTTSPQKMQRLKQRLNEFLHELVSEAIDEGDNSEVYHLAVQLFPLTSSD